MDRSRKSNSNSDPIIEAEGLEISFPGNNWPVLSKVDFEIPRRSITCIAGPSGVGKSTLMNVAIGLLKPTDGYMKVFGNVIHEVHEDKLNKLRHRMGILFQSGALFQSMPLIENVMFPLIERNECSRETARERAKKVLNDVELNDNTFDLTPDRLSGGQNKRGGLARSLVTQPELLICDEPSSGLDPVTAMKIDELFLKLHEKNPEQTMVIVSHDLNSIKEIADYIVFVHEHREYPEYHSVRVHGPSEEILSDPDPVVQEFFCRKDTSKTGSAC